MIWVMFTECGQLNVHTYMSAYWLRVLSCIVCAHVECSCEMLMLPSAWLVVAWASGSERHTCMLGIRAVQNVVAALFQFFVMLYVCRSSIAHS